MIFAEADPTGGWLQLLLQGGAFALLTYIVVVLFPREAEAARDERKRRDEALAVLVADLQAKFDRRNQLIQEAVKEQTATLVAEMRSK